MKYPTVKDGEWVRPIKKGYKMKCCDCGLVHILEFSHIPYGNGRKIIFRAWRQTTRQKRANKNKGQ